METCGKLYQKSKRRINTKLRIVVVSGGCKGDQAEEESEEALKADVIFCF